MYYTCDKKTGKLLSWSDVLEFEQNTNSEEFVYVDDYIVICKGDDFDYTWLDPKNQDEIK